MNWSFFFSELFKALGAGTVLSLSLAFLFRKGLAHWLTKDIEKYKSDLQRALTKFSNRHSLLCEKHAEIVAALYCKLWDIQDAINLYTKAGNENYLSRSVTATGECKDYLNRNRIFFDKMLSGRIESLLHRFRLLEGELQHGSQSNLFSKQQEEFADRCLKLVLEADEALATLEERFRQLLRGEDDFDVTL